MYRIDYRRLVANDDLATLRNLEPALLAAVQTEAVNPANVPKGEIRKVEEWDENGVVKYNKFIGQECFTKTIGRPGRNARIWDERSKSWYGRAQQT
jgi:hypothetical protein